MTSVKRSARKAIRTSTRISPARRSRPSSSGSLSARLRAGLTAARRAGGAALFAPVEDHDGAEIHRLFGRRELDGDLEIAGLVIAVRRAGDLKVLPLRPASSRKSQNGSGINGAARRPAR